MVFSFFIFLSHRPYPCRIAASWVQGAVSSLPAVLPDASSRIPFEEESPNESSTPLPPDRQLASDLRELPRQLCEGPG